MSQVFDQKQALSDDRVKAFTGRIIEPILRGGFRGGKA